MCVKVRKSSQPSEPIQSVYPRNSVSWNKFIYDFWAPSENREENDPLMLDLHSPSIELCGCDPAKHLRLVLSE